MRSALKTLFVCACLSLALTRPLSTLAWTAAAPAVPIEDSAYDDIDLLVSHRLISDAVVGQRPYSRAEMARLAITAEQNLREREPTKATDFLFRVVEKLKQRFPKSPPDKKVRLNANLLEEATITLDALSLSPRPENSPTIAATNNALVQNRGGRHLVSGLQSAFETSHSLAFSPYASLFIKPRLQLQAIDSDDHDEEHGLFLQEGYATISAFNTQLDVGRKPLIWGQSRFGGMLFSNHARPLDAIQLTNPTPWDIPYLGHLKYTFFFGTLGPEQNFSWAQISGGKITLKPFAFLELGVARALLFSGNGAPNASAGDIFKEFFGARGEDQFSGNADLSNSLSGFEWRLSLPFFRGTSVYNEIYFDDFDIRYPLRSIVQDAAVLVGIAIPRLDPAGTWSLNLEGRKLSPILYRHSSWTSGWTLNGFILGDPLGADSESLRLRLQKRLRAGETAFYGQFDLERIDSDQYGTGDSGRVVQVNGVAETRLRQSLGARHRLNRFFSGNLAVGYENVRNFGFASGVTKNNILFTGQLSFEPDWGFLRIGQSPVTDRTTEKQQAGDGKP